MTLPTVLLLLVASHINAQYLTEANFIPYGAVPGLFTSYSLASDVNNSGFPDLLSLTSSGMFVTLDPAMNGFTPLPQQLGAGFLSANDEHGVVADIDLDGSLDLHFNGSYATATLRGNGNGTFSLPHVVWALTVLGTPLYLRRQTPFDANNDNAVDLFILGSVASVSTAGDLLLCYINQYPNWTLAWYIPFPYGLPSTACCNNFIAGDFDGDGNKDVAVSYVFSATQTRTNILYGSGTGSFTPLSATTTPGFPNNTTGSTTYPLMMAAADMDGNGTSDIVISTVASTTAGAPETLQILLGNANRTLTPAGSITLPGPSSAGAGLAPLGTHAADFNGDGWGDILRIERPANFVLLQPCLYSIVMALGRPLGQLHQAVMTTNHSPAAGLNCPLPVIADFDSDFDLDFVCAWNYSPLYYFRNRAFTGTGCAGTGGSSPALLFGDPVTGNAQFTAGLSCPLGNAPAVLAIAAGLNSASLPGFCGVHLDLLGPVLYLPAATDAGGNAVYSLPLANIPALIGTPVFAQAAVIDPLALLLGGLNLALSAARTVIIL